MATKSPWQKGQALEKEIEELYKSRGYLTWRPQKMKYTSQDVFGVADIVATSSTDFILIAVAKGRMQTNTKRKILALLPHLPKFITIKYHIEKTLKDGRKIDVKTWKGRRKEVELYG